MNTYIDSNLFLYLVKSHFYLNFFRYLYEFIRVKAPSATFCWFYSHEFEINNAIVIRAISDKHIAKLKDVILYILFVCNLPLFIMLIELFIPSLINCYRYIIGDNYCIKYTPRLLNEKLIKKQSLCLCYALIVYNQKNLY